MKFYYPAICLVLCVFICADSFGQSRRRQKGNTNAISIETGMGILLFTTKVGQYSGNADFTNNQAIGGVFGINYEKSLPNNLLAIGGIRYSLKGGGIWTDDPNTIVITPGESVTSGTINYNYRLNYLEVPMTAAYKIGNNHSYIGLGLIPGLLVSQKYVKQLTSKKAEKQEIDYANPLQLDIGIEGRTYLNDKVPLHLFLEVNYGMLNAFKEDTHNGYNTKAKKVSFYFGVSYRFRK